MSKESIIQEAKENGKFLSAIGLQNTVKLIKKYIDSKIDNLKDHLSSLINSKQNRLIVGRGLKLSPAGELAITLDTTIFKVVSELPAKPGDNDLNKIFVVIPEGSEGKNHEEYIWLPSSNKWEQLGSFSTEVDLSNYVTIAALNSKVAELKQELVTKQYVDSTFATKAYVDSHINQGLVDRVTKLESLVNGYSSGISSESSEG